jgi:hypothetical protein
MIFFTAVIALVAIVIKFHERRQHVLYGRYLVPQRSQTKHPSGHDPE